jgi:hypothetical protein
LDEAQAAACRVEKPSSWHAVNFTFNLEMNTACHPFKRKAGLVRAVFISDELKFDIAPDASIYPIK